MSAADLLSANEGEKSENTKPSSLYYVPEPFNMLPRLILLGALFPLEQVQEVRGLLHRQWHRRCSYEEGDEWSP